MSNFFGDVKEMLKMKRRTNRVEQHMSVTFCESMCANCALVGRKYMQREGTSKKPYQHLIAQTCSVENAMERERKSAAT